jgi:hypothetical protein
LFHREGSAELARHVVRVRLDPSGMRRIEGRAEAVSLLRCIEVNADREAFRRCSQGQRDQEPERGRAVQIRSRTPAQLPEVA